MSTAPTDDDNRRKHPRTELSLLVQYRFHTFEEFLEEVSLNISPGGMFIRTDAPHEEDSVIFLKFSLTDGSKLLEGMGRVVRVNPPGEDGRVAGMGVEFLNFDDDSVALIEDICAHRESRTQP